MLLEVPVGVLDGVLSGLRAEVLVRGVTRLPLDSCWLCWTFASPPVTMRSPPRRPAVTSTASSPRTPMVTARRSATPPRTTHTESESASPPAAPGRSTAPAGTVTTSRASSTTSETTADMPGSGVGAGSPPSAVPPS